MIIEVLTGRALVHRKTQLTFQGASNDDLASIYWYLKSSFGFLDKRKSSPSERRMYESPERPKV